jgi:hypothetical protein
MPPETIEPFLPPFILTIVWIFDLDPQVTRSRILIDAGSMLRHDPFQIELAHTLVKPSPLPFQMTDVEEVRGPSRQNPFQERFPP